jgi:hypothetical protein
VRIIVEGEPVVLVSTPCEKPAALLSVLSRLSGRLQSPWRNGVERNTPGPAGLIASCWQWRLMTSPILGGLSIWRIFSNDTQPSA